MRVGFRKVDYQYGLPIVIQDGHATQTVDFAPQHAQYVRMQGDQRATGRGFPLWTMSVVDSAALGTDLALHKTATSSSVGDGKPPGNAVDGDPNTRWSSQYADGEWRQVDLGAASDLDRVVPTWETAYARKFRIQTSQDGQNWTDVASVDNSAKPRWPVGAPWYLHDWSSNGNQSPQSHLAAIDARLAPLTSLEEFCRKAQFVNYENMRAIFEAWSSKLWHDVTGVLLWMSHPAWHSTVWQTCRAGRSPR